MTLKELSRLQEKFFAGLCSSKEADALMRYEVNLELADETWRPENGNQQLLKYRILEQLHHEMEPVPVKPFWFRYYYAAAAMLLIALFTLLFYLSIDDPLQKLADGTKARSESTIKPGSNKATLTFSDGSVIDLSDAESGLISKQGDVTVGKTADGKFAGVLKSLELTGAVHFKIEGRRMTVMP